MNDACQRIQGNWIKVVASYDLPRGSYFCLECGSRAVLRRGDYRVPHFAHAMYDPRGDACPFKSAPADTLVGSGQFFRATKDPAPIREAQESHFSETLPAFSRAAHLKFWLTAQRQNTSGWGFTFHLGLPQLGLDTQGMTQLHNLALAINQVPSGESHAWRLWPGSGQSLIEVPLLDRYSLFLDPNWPSDPRWRCEALMAAQVVLDPEGNLFEVEEDTGALRGRLISPPVTLVQGSKCLYLSQDRAHPPKPFAPIDMGTYQGWRVWQICTPWLEDLDAADRAWAESKAWRLAQERTVRLTSPPPIGFDGQVPVYPPGPKGWLLVESDPSQPLSAAPRAWQMEAPESGSRFVIPDGRSPGKAICNAKAVVWEDVPDPMLLLLEEGVERKVLPLTGQSLVHSMSSEEAEHLTWAFRSAFPLEIWAGAPGQLQPMVWHPHGRFPELDAGIKEFLRKATAFQIHIQGPGIARMVIEFVAPAGTLRGARPSGYHNTLKRHAGWPHYTSTRAMESLTCPAT